MGMEDEANGKQPPVSDAERHEADSRGSITEEDFVVEIISPGDVQNYDHLPLEYAGFCPVALVRYKLRTCF